eukprot:749481-Hanusia_phi.AAC.16
MEISSQLWLQMKQLQDEFSAVSTLGVPHGEPPGALLGSHARGSPQARDTFALLLRGDEVSGRFFPRLSLRLCRPKLVFVRLESGWRWKMSHSPSIGASDTPHADETMSPRRKRRMIVNMRRNELFQNCRSGDEIVQVIGLGEFQFSLTAYNQNTLYYHHAIIMLSSSSTSTSSRLILHPPHSFKRGHLQPASSSST